MLSPRTSRKCLRLITLALLSIPTASLAQVPAPPAPPDPRKASDEISSRLVNNRMLEFGSWKINALGQGEIKITNYLGLAFDNRDTGVGDIRFAEGVHRFDIGAWGYDLLKYELGNIIMGRLDPFKGVATDCGIQHPGFSEVAWTLNREAGRFRMDALCTLPSEIEALRERNVNAWRILGRFVMRYGWAGVSETQQGGRSLKRKPLKLGMNHSNVWSGNNINWELGPDGKGWLESRKTVTLRSWTPNGMPMMTILPGKAKFDIGKDGYTRVRGELDPYILGPAGKTECLGSTEDQASATLRWQVKNKWVRGLNKDTGCADYGGRVHWVIAFLGARVAARPVTISSP